MRSEVGKDNVAVMYDGTWQKRGHKSHNGIGMVVDFAWTSPVKLCLACSQHMVLPDEEEEVWQAFHAAVCEKNVDCSVHAMEAEAALRIWQRSQEHATPLLFGLFLGDGDSKAYNAVVDADVYDGAVQRQKEDCANRVAEHLGTNIRKVKDPLPRGEKLKDPVTQKLQTYYQVAITSNWGSVQGMHQAIWASYFRSCSSDGIPASGGPGVGILAREALSPSLNRCQACGQPLFHPTGPSVPPATFLLPSPSPPTSFPSSNQARVRTSSQERFSKVPPPPSIAPAVSPIAPATVNPAPPTMPASPMMD
ncbi:hypothetical protein HPB48_005153 [Haemaphysalis longicornis]|uniref:Mutator-like transposase domain-containing protein n=1 Tax=Haemaphysalis longicornis TaxID=44386 RepID=A0A9J6F7B9_HAELO|nr:hypothetical protein HPB48_005153 [Haemaphysalis longicornis]